MSECYNGCVMLSTITISIGREDRIDGEMEVG